jgi:hypothetical protein
MEPPTLVRIGIGKMTCPCGEFSLGSDHGPFGPPGMSVKGTCPHCGCTIEAFSKED